MSHPHHGHLGHFNPANETWSSYAERLDLANDVRDEKKKAILLSVCGPETFQLLRNLAQPATLQEKTYAQLAKLLSEHFEPAPSPIIQRFQFNTRTKKMKESVAEYIAELKKIARHCDYKDTLNDMLRDRLVCGVNDTRIERALLQESKELTFEKALEQAITNSKHFQQSAPIQRLQHHDRERQPSAGHRVQNQSSGLLQMWRDQSPSQQLSFHL